MGYTVPPPPMSSRLTKDERLIRDIDRVLNEIPWLPLYEQDGADFLDEMYRCSREETRRKALCPSGPAENDY